MIKCVAKITMSLSPEKLLSSASRDRCVAILKQLPKFIKDGNKKANASVLLPLCVHNGDLCILYTLRSLNLSSHSGQVSFPGGKIDANETALDAALRETEEEIGVPAKDVSIWAEMSEVQGRNKHVVIKPIVGVINNFDMKKLKPNVDEVAEIFTVPIKGLCDVNNHAHLMYENDVTPVYLCGKHKIWGITGFITHIFLQAFLSEDYIVDFFRKQYQFEELLPSKL